MRQTEANANPCEIEQQLRRWLESQRAGAEALVPGARFSLNRAIELVYGDLTPECLSSEGGIVQYVLDFANGAAVRSEAIRSLQADETRKRLPTQVGKLSDQAELSLAALFDELSDHAQLARRTALRAFLSLVRSDLDSARSQFGAAAGALWQKAWLLPIQRPYAISTEYHLVVTNLETFSALIWSLFLDDERPFRRELRQCKYSECNKFFLKPARPGHPHELYCPEYKHMEKGRAERAAFDKRIARVRDGLLKKRVAKDSARSLAADVVSQNLDCTTVKTLVELAMSSHRAR